MPNTELPKKLLNLSGFQRKYLPAVLQSVARQFEGLEVDESIYEGEPIDWNYLILCASVLAGSDTSECLDVAYRIAQYSLVNERTDVEQKAAAAIVLDSLTNTPSIQLAIQRGYLSEDYSKGLPLPLQLEKIKRGIQYSILAGDNQGMIPINRFQADVYESAQELDWMSISAPTSSGKSFILLKILSEFFTEKKGEIAVYIVPTRSLIQQVESDISQTFNEQGINEVFITSVPILPKEETPPALVYVLTQERLQWLLNDEPELILQLVIVDEAQKIGDGARGVLLQQVIEEVSRRSAFTKVIFSSPMTSNPEILLEPAPKDIDKRAIISEHVAVNQNLIWVSQVPMKPRVWSMDLCLGEATHQLGHFTLPYRPTATSKRLPFISYSLAENAGGNLVYVNGPSDAEKTAMQLYELQGEETTIHDKEVLDLIQLIKNVINPNYVLVKTLTRGVGFHYGNMPLLVKNELEKLFKHGKIKFLVCTSTLIEGMNLPAKSIFVRGPQKGKGRPMGEIDFWNLAGRAGRQGKEFQGNVICIDPMREDAWKVPPPRIKHRFPIQPTINEIVLKNGSDLIEFIESDTPRNVAAKRPELEHTFVYFLGEYLRKGTLHEHKILKKSDATLVTRLEKLVEKTIEGIDIPKEVILHNPGISPIALQNLLQYFENYESEVEDLIPVLPESDDALTNYIKLVDRISRYLSGDSEKLNYPHALLVLYWIRGDSLSLIINKNWRYWKNHGKNLAQVIRDTMRDIEEYARFKFVKYSSCYIDVLKYYLMSIDREDLVEKIPSLNIWLEFGASQLTQVSLMSLGLSRTSAIAVSELIVADGLTVKECIQWLFALNLAGTDLSPIIMEEIRQVLRRHQALLD
ncbi:DEAD/DEAH box helicase [Brevibacillus centrosporus]|uniref:DEAD/DEAH box helicase n=1 Tax=Brevibacillus centrosporus TaxID=54910 RepID=UPI003B024623